MAVVNPEDAWTTEIYCSGCGKSHGPKTRWPIMLPPPTFRCVDCCQKSKGQCDVSGVAGAVGFAVLVVVVAFVVTLPMMLAK